jgi:hypothetical protein
MILLVGLVITAVAAAAAAAVAVVAVAAAVVHDGWCWGVVVGCGGYGAAVVVEVVLWILQLK